MARRLLAVAIPAGLAVAVGGFFALGGLSIFDSRLVAACEEAIKSGLLVPSSYHRANLHEAAEAISLDDYFGGQHEEPAVEEFERANYRQANRLSAQLSYDAANGYGAPVRAGVTCTYDYLGDRPQPSKWGVRLDGKTVAQRLVDRVRQDAE
jgi:hypothetical protein